MDKVRINCMCKPVAGVTINGELEVCRGQNILQLAKDWYENQVADLHSPVGFEHCYVHIDGGVVSRKEACFMDDVYVNGRSEMHIIPVPVEEQQNNMNAERDALLRKIEEQNHIIKQNEDVLTVYKLMLKGMGIPDPFELK